MTRSLSAQISAVRHCIASADVNDQVRANAEAGLSSLEWIERNAEVIRTVYRLMQHKAVQTVLASFPGAELFPSEVSHAFGREASEGTAGSEGRFRLGGYQKEVRDFDEPSATDGGLI